MVTVSPIKHLGQSWFSNTLTSDRSSGPGAVNAVVREHNAQVADHATTVLKHGESDLVFADIFQSDLVRHVLQTLRNKLTKAIPASGFPNSDTSIGCSPNTFSIYPGPRGQQCRA